MAEIGHSRIAMNVNEESCNTINRDADSKAEGESSTKRQAFETLTDRISELPDSLILHILFLLDSTKEAVKTSALSKRWRYLWTSLQSLNFCYWFYFKSTVSDLVSFVTETLAKCNADLKLNSFKLHFDFRKSSKSDMDSWILYAVRRKVEEFAVNLGHASLGVDRFLLPQHLFVNSVFTKLRLGYCLFEPNRQIKWKMLKVLRISDTALTEDLIENILSGSPLLESFELAECYGFNRLDITSRSVKRLVFDGYSARDDLFDNYDDIIEVNAPNILSLDIRGTFFLWKLLLLDMSSLVVADLNYIKCGKLDTTSKETKEEMLKGLIKSLHNVKELTVGYSCSKVVSRLEAKGFSFPENMKFPVGPSTWDCFSDSSEDEDMEDPNVDHEANIDDGDHGYGGSEVDHGHNGNDVNHGSNSIEFDNVPDDNEIDR